MEVLICVQAEAEKIAEAGQGTEGANPGAGAEVDPFQGLPENGQPGQVNGQGVVGQGEDGRLEPGFAEDAHLHDEDVSGCPELLFHACEELAGQGRRDRGEAFEGGVERGERSRHLV